MLLINRPTQFNDTTAVKPNQVILIKNAIPDGTIFPLKSFMSMLDIKPQSLDLDELHVEYYICHVNDAPSDVILVRDEQNNDIKHCDLSNFLEEPFSIYKQDNYRFLRQL